MDSNHDLSPADVTHVALSIDPILPDAMARRAELAGVKRATMDPVTLLVLSVLAGAFISFGAIFATTVGAGINPSISYGVGRLLSGLVFSVGLLLVVIGGAELFTGNTMIVMAWANRKVSTRALLTNWILVFSGNVIGATATAGLMFLTAQYTYGGGAVGLNALAIAQSKSALSLVPAVTLGIMCNALVCLTVWMCYAARTTVDRVVTIVPPIAAFVAAGFEHCIANAYFIPMGLFIKAGAPDSFWAKIEKSPADFPDITWSNYLWSNLAPVTLGNIIGGSIMVAAVYWFVYLRPGASLPKST